MTDTPVLSQEEIEDLTFRASVAAPDGEGGTMALIDQSASVIAKSEIMKHARDGLPISPECTLDPDGQPTTDPEITLRLSMTQSGGYKGVDIALMVSGSARLWEHAH